MSRIKTMITKFICYFNNKIKNNHKANKRDIYKKHNPFIRIKNATTGITLVALVVTIVVLLILSGITIATLSGDNGVIPNAKEMANSVNSVQSDAEKELQELSNQLSDVVVVEPDDIGDWEYVVDSATNTVTITAYKGNNTEIVVPNYIGGHPVRKVGNDIDGYLYHPIWSTEVVLNTASWMTTEKNNFIKRITISNGIEIIDSCCFAFCEKVKRIDIPNSVKTIGKYAFANCTELINITIPNNVTNIAEGTFNNCTGLTNITIPSSITSIANAAFLSCTGLTNITIPNSVTSIGGLAFAYCTGLTNIEISSGVRSIGYYAFENCTGLTNVTIPSSVTNMGTSVFYKIPSITVMVPFSSGNKPSGWDSYWNHTTSGCTVTVKYQ